MATNKSNDQSSNDDFVMPSVFGTKPANALLIPSMPIVARNNCQIGQWVIGDKTYGSECSMTILKFAKFYGELGQTKNTQWGQLWFVAESGNLPRGMVMATYIKSRGLQAFNNLVASIMSRGIEPATGIFVPEFIMHSGNRTDETGATKPTNYFSLKWDWRERKQDEYDILKQAATILTDPSNMGNLIDIEGTKRLVNIDGLSPERLAQVLQNENPNEAIGILPNATLNALPAGSSNA